MVWPMVAAMAIGAGVGAYGGRKEAKSRKRRYRRYRNKTFSEFNAMFADIKRLRGESLASSRVETGQAISTLKGMEAEQLGQVGKVFEGERTRAGDELKQMTAQNRSAMAGAGISGSSVDAGLARQANAAGMRQYQQLGGQEAALRTGILGQSRGAQAQVHASRPETQVNQAFAEAQFGARQQKIGFLQSLMFNGPSTATAMSINSGLQGAGAGMQALGSFNLYKDKDWEPGWMTS